MVIDIIKIYNKKTKKYNRCMILKCDNKNCGIYYGRKYTKRDTKRFNTCSRKCTAKYMHDNKMIPTKYGFDSNGNIKNAPIIKLICEKCSKEFERNLAKYEYQIKNKNTKKIYCSNECCIADVLKDNKKRPKDPNNYQIIQCNNCKKDFIVINYDQRVEKDLKFCSIKCSKKYLIGDKHPNTGRKMSDKQKAFLSKFWKGKRCGKNSPLYGKKLSIEARNKMSKSISERIKNGHWYSWGKREYIYNPFTKQKELMDSQGESKFFNKNLKNNINIIKKHGIVIKYYDDEINRRYHPDFLLKDYNMIVEIKGDRNSITSFKITQKKQATIDWCIKNNHSYLILQPKNYIKFFNFIT